MQLGFVAALTDEARTLEIGRGKGNVARKCLVETTGPGNEPARRAAQTLIERGAQGLVSWGTSGALDPALPPGAIVIYKTALSHDGETYQCEPAWCERLMTVLATLSPTFALGFTAASAVATYSEKAALAKHTGCAALDMESAAVGECAHVAGLPFVAIRVIVDPFNFDIPRAALLALKDGGQPQIWPVVRGVVRHPQELPALLRLAGWYRAALRQLRLAANLLQPSFAAN